MSRLLTERLLTAANRVAPGTAHDLRALLEVAADTITRLEEELVASRDACAQLARIDAALAQPQEGEA